MRSISISAFAATITFIFLGLITQFVSTAPLEEKAKEWDYIVVGSGPAGLVAADRLSETGKSVLLLERGPPSTYENGGRDGPAWALKNELTRFDVPGLCNRIWVDSTGVACNDLDQMAGCVLGGGTAVNAGLFLRVPTTDWDVNFPEGWKAKDMAGVTEKVFKRIPSTDTPSMDGRRYVQESYNLVSGFLSKAGWKEITANQSPNEKNLTFTHSAFMYLQGTRGGPLATYLRTAKSRPNFSLAVNTTVNRVLRTSGKITGVNVSAFGKGGIDGDIKVKEGTGRVVLAAGAFGTAKILMRSGIGPRDMLEVVKASKTDGEGFIGEKEWIGLPVGYNLLDHTNTDVVVKYPKVVSYDYYGAWDKPSGADSQNYLSKRAGPLAQAAPGPNTIFWEKFDGFSDGKSRQIQWTARSEGSLGFSGEITMSQYLGTGTSSRGRLSILPNLNMTVSTLPFLKDADDTAAVIKGIKSLQAAAAAANVPGLEFLAPAPNVTVEEYVRSYRAARRSSHWIGTAKIGKDDGRKMGGKNGAVVDLNTKVYGTDNLYVVDASIFPGHLATNPAAAIMIAAEKAVEKILSS